MPLPNSYILCLSAAMEELDGDEVRVSSRGRLAERDIVQVQYILHTHYCSCPFMLILNVSTVALRAQRSAT